MGAYKSNTALVSTEADIAEIETMLYQLHQRQKVFKWEYEKIRTLPKHKQIDDSEIKLVYNEFKSNLGDVIVKSLNDVVDFKNKVEKFQQVIIDNTARELEQQISEISEQIRILEEQYIEKMRILDKKMRI